MIVWMNERDNMCFSTCVSMFPRFFSGLHLHKTYMRSSVIVELCQGWLISKAIDGIRKS